MLTFDTLKFSFPLSALKRYNKNSFEFTHTTTRELLSISKKATCRTPILGLKTICIDFLREIVLIEVSAKILESSYLDGINANNFEFILKKITDTSIIYFNYKTIIPLIRFYRLDVTTNLIFQEEIKTHIRTLSYTVNQSNFTYTTYRNNSVVFCKNPSSKRHRLRFLFYDKFEELKRDKSFCNNVDINFFKNILRYEINFVNYHQIRKYFNLSRFDDFSFNNLILNKTNIPREIFLELLKNSKSFLHKTSLFDDDKSLYELEKYFGMYKICDNFNFDYSKIKIFLNSKVKGNISKYLQRYKDLCYKKNQQISNNNLSNNLTKIYEKICSATNN